MFICSCGDSQNPSSNADEDNISIIFSRSPVLKSSAPFFSTGDNTV